MRPEYDFSNAERGRFHGDDARFHLPRALDAEWADGDGPIPAYIVAEAKKTLDAYRAQPSLVVEHANHELDMAKGGYAHRQLFELVQNSADAITGVGRGSVLVRLTTSYLYCADDGQPMSADGVRALMFSHLSPKRNTNEIGRFGLGFKSVLGVTNGPEFFSRNGSFRFDAQEAARRIGAVAQAERYPTLRLPSCISANEEAHGDDDLAEMMTWATNIVRLPLKPDAHDDLAQQIEEFPAEFLLFVDDVRHLALEINGGSRDIHVDRVADGVCLLDSGTALSKWKTFKTEHTLSAAAQADRRTLDDDETVPIWWAVPLDRLNEPGQFWHFFPTQTPSLLAGILNAPWKTNEDRQNLLSGPYNEDLVDAAAELAADHVTELADSVDPALHLDALPRRREAGDTEHSIRLREQMEAVLGGAEVVPDQGGCLRRIGDVRYAPELQDAAALQHWQGIEHRPQDWAHHRVLTRERMAKLDRLYASPLRVPRATIGGWLESLVAGVSPERAVEASRKAVQVAASTSKADRVGRGWEGAPSQVPLGRIVLTRTGNWVEPDPDNVFLPTDSFPAAGDVAVVHPELVSEPSTLDALNELGIKRVSPEGLFRSIAESTLTSADASGERWHAFWTSARELPASEVYDIIGPRRAGVCARTLSGEWEKLFAVLLPGRIVAGNGAYEDRDVTVDTIYHELDLEVLRRLGAASEPRPAYDVSVEPGFPRFQRDCRAEFTARDLPRNPHQDKLMFSKTTCSGPVYPLQRLSERGKALYTQCMLNMPETFDPWTMRHETQEIYEPLECDNLALATLREHGRIHCGAEYVPLADALGDAPANAAAVMALLSLPNAKHIKDAFDLLDPSVEPIDAEDSIPLMDVWPGLAQYFEDAHAYDLIRCRRIVDDALDCLLVGTDVYLVSAHDDSRDLDLVCGELGIDLDSTGIAQVLEYTTPGQVEGARRYVSAGGTDAERLARAVGDRGLRDTLSGSLINTIEAQQGPLDSVQLAEAVIASFHTSALKECRHALDPALRPPRQFAGSAEAIAFVKQLGFSAQWAGQRNARRPRDLVVDGPTRLPPLHSFQQVIVDRVREMLLGRGDRRRGMLSLPTGAGKTRVAVEAIISAMCSGFAGGVLWVADRDELCEQAVEAWSQGWRSLGAVGERLRISRLWGGQPRPTQETRRHVVVASIQTLSARLDRRGGEYTFLRDFDLVVFDEAHRSVAPTYTTVMSEIGFTRSPTADEPFLIGLTATPYRGHDERETERLVRRYGSSRLDQGAFRSDDPVAVVRELQDKHVIAQADHEVIEGAGVQLNEGELAELRSTPNAAWLPRSVESRIALDVSRTGRILAAYEGQVETGWPTLIFATSVQHAQTVAALLNSKGIPSRAVSGSTDATVRRQIVDDFRAGRIATLVNYGVFREGFDAPNTRVIIVARPVYSPNLYFQMIGRGLRGPKNGGNDRCLIVNVRDNIENFERELAFAELDWLWGH